MNVVVLVLRSATEAIPRGKKDVQVLQKSVERCAEMQREREKGASMSLRGFWPLQDKSCPSIAEEDRSTLGRKPVTSAVGCRFQLSIHIL